MIKIKKGFTLSEVLICIMIIGIIMALSVQTIKIVKTSYAALGYFAFNTVQALAASVSVGNEIGIKPYKDESGNIIHTTVPCYITKTLVSTGSSGDKVINVYKNVIKPDDYPDTTTVVTPCNSLASGGSNNHICRVMAEAANTTGKINCEKLFNVNKGGSGEPSISDLVPNNPTFKTTNGFRYYLSQHVSGDTSVSSDYGYRLLAVDLNGKRGPNSAAVSLKQVPDIITFLILDNGDVYPLGVAADNLVVSKKKDNIKMVQYINSKIKGYYFGDDPSRLEPDKVMTANVPMECQKIKILSMQYHTEAGVDYNQNVNNNPNSVNICNFGITSIPNPNSDSTEPKYLYSYREAYCASLGYSTPSYPNYCEGKKFSTLCPPSDDAKKVDLCMVDNVKPLFRYNLK